MLKIIILLYFLHFSASAFKLFSLPPTPHTQARPNWLQAAISPGKGYSRDRQQMSDLVCFNTKASPYSKTESIVRFDQGSTFTEVQTSLKVDVTTKVNIWIFSVEVSLEYMKEIRDTDYTLSINYYQMVQSELTMEMGYGPAGALTLDGLKAYGQIDHPNPRFGLICGDRFISSYKLGASLIFSIKLHFHSHFERDTFKAKIGVKFGPFNIVSKEIQKVAESLNTSGEVKILAYQSGGNPAELSKLMNGSCEDKYCAASCSLVRITDCDKSINGLFDYAISRFTSQVNVQDPKTMVPFSVGFANMQDIKWVGLDAPASYVTPDVLSMREQLGNATLKQQYYAEALALLLQAKLPWVKTSRLYSEINNCIAASKKSYDSLMDQSIGGINCFNDPENCPSNGKTLLSQLSLCNPDYILSSIQYKLSIDICSASLYRVGETTNWTASTIDPKCSSFTLRSINVLPQSMAYTIDVVYRGDSTTHSYIGDNLHSANADASFSGTRHHKWGSNDVVQNAAVGRIVSEYYFTP